VGHAGCGVVSDLQAERFKQPPGLVVGHVVQVDYGDWQVIEQGRVAGVLGLLLGLGDLAFQVLFPGAELGVALLDAADEVGAEVIGGLQGASSGWRPGGCAGRGRRRCLPGTG
jgi:hypothetical protein